MLARWRLFGLAACLTDGSCTAGTCRWTDAKLYHMCDSLCQAAQTSPAALCAGLSPSCAGKSQQRCMATTRPGCLQAQARRCWRGLRLQSAGPPSWPSSPPQSPASGLGTACATSRPPSPWLPSWRPASCLWTRYAEACERCAGYSMPTGRTADHAVPLHISPFRELPVPAECMMAYPMRCSRSSSKCEWTARPEEGV